MNQRRADGDLGNAEHRLRQGSRGHPVIDELRAYALGRLSGPRARLIEEHVEQCPRCAQDLASVPDDTLVGLARDAARQTQVAGLGLPPRQTPADPDPPEIPRELREHPRYEVLGPIGSGGMGAVYKAQHRLMERLVALKVIKPRFVANRQAVERFLREVRGAARLNHPNIVTSFDAEQAGDLHLLVMEFVDGVSLDRLYPRAKPLSVAMACQIARSMAAGLAHAHARGMVHRDIKPQNVMLTRGGQVKLLDFGLARLATVDEPPPPLADSPFPAGLGWQTSAGAFLGTPDYVAPEQAVNAAAADARSDLYSLGCTLYFLLTGRPPFPHGSTLDKLESHLTEPVDAVCDTRPDVPPALAEVLERLLQKRPEDRFGSASDVVSALAPFTGRAEASPENNSAAALDSPPVAPRGSPDTVAAAGPTEVQPVFARARWQTLQKTLSRRSVMAGLGGGVLALVCAGSWGWFGANPQRGATSPARRPGENGGAAKPTETVDRGRAPPRQSPTPGPESTGRVLYIIPNRGLWYADYGPVVRRLEAAGYTVVTAGPAAGRCSVLDDPQWPQPPAVECAVAIDGQVRAADYDAVVVGGYDVRPFLDGQLRRDLTRLLREFQDQGKVVGAICAGQAVLAHLRLLDGKRAAGGRFARNDFASPQQNGPRWTENDIELENSGRLVTARDDKAAAAFSDALTNGLRGTQPE